MVNFLKIDSALYYLNNNIATIDKSRLEIIIKIVAFRLHNLCKMYINNGLYKWFLILFKLFLYPLLAL